MTLIPDDLRTRLLANGAAETEADPLPVLKLYLPFGRAVWLVTEMMPDGDTLFGLADLGMGFPELGYMSLAEIEAVRASPGLRILRDERFAPRFPLSVYAEAARLAGEITEDEALLLEIAVSLGKHPIRPDTPS